jgi:hypothetical protein
MVKKIYPTHHMKYCGGSIKEINEKTFIAKVDTRNRHSLRITLTKRFNTYRKAIRFIRRGCKKHGLPIKNMIYDRKTHYECVLTSNKVMLFDKQDLEKVQTHVIHASRSRDQTWYAVARTSGKTSFANIIMNHNVKLNPSITVDHVTHGDGLDNRRKNLRFATRSEQNINQRTRISNTSGAKGVHFDKSYGKDKWVARWMKETKKRMTKSFSCKTHGYEKAKQMAIDYRAKMVAESDCYSILRRGNDKCV